MKEFAQRLISIESTNISIKTNPKALVVCDKLRPHLSTLMGNAGYRALISRCLALATAEVPALHAVNVKTDGSLGGFAELEPHVDPKEVAEGGVLLVTQLLNLLVAFIGESLTVRLIREVWPELTLNDLNLGNGDKK